jgi:hypothetical protein
MRLFCLQEAEGGALASFTGTMRYSSGLIADQKRTAAALVRVSKMMGKVRHPVAAWHPACCGRTLCDTTQAGPYSPAPGLRKGRHKFAAMVLSWQA